jgi:ADP-ribose pyrophosphatase
MDDNINRPLINITNVIWSFNKNTNELLVLLLKRSKGTFKGMWGLPTTFLREDENAEEASLRLVREKIGVDLPRFNTEQLATFTDIHRSKTRELALTYMIYLPDMPKLVPGYGADDAKWFSVQAGKNDYILSQDNLIFHTLKDKVTSDCYYAKQEKYRNDKGLASDNALILRVAFERIRNRLNYSPTILLILGSTFTLRLARIVYSIFLRIPLEEIDNSNFRKTHRHLFLEAGSANIKGAGRPGKIYRLK